MNNDDLISRQAAIDEVKALQEEAWKYCRDPQLSECDVIHRIRTLPSIQPEIEPKTGHWIEDAKTYYEELKIRSLGVDEYTPYFTDDIACSECLAKYSVLDNETQFFKYCPNCGAKMESEVE